MNTLTLNKTLDLVEPSKSVTLLAKVRQMQETDSSILNLTGGEPDFDTPKAICEEAYKQLLAGNTHYANSKGDPELRAAIAKKLLEENNAPYSAENILITPGAKYAIYAAVQAIINPGDEVLWFTPGWVSYPAIVTLCGGTPVAVNLDYDNDYVISGEQLESLTTDRTKLLILNYPNNPTGKILSEDDIAVLKTFLRNHPDILVISDEIYEKIIFDSNKCISIASDPEFFDRTIIVNGFSKCAAMTGWRIGYLACCPQLYNAIQKIFQHSMSCTNSFVQKAAIVALNIPEETEAMRAAYEQRRNILVEGFKDIPNAELKTPSGSFYAWIKFTTDKTSEELCNLILEKAGIGGIPGSAFGVENECMVRFCYAKQEDVLTDFVSRMKEFCKAWL